MQDKEKPVRMEFFVSAADYNDIMRAIELRYSFDPDSNSLDGALLAEICRGWLKVAHDLNRA